MILVKCFLPDEKPEIIPFPLQSVSDKGDFTFNKATLISVEHEKQAMIARELTDLFTLSAGFTPEIKIQPLKLQHQNQLQFLVVTAFFVL